MPLTTVNIDSYDDPNAVWNFSRDTSCQHPTTRKVNLGSYQDGNVAGTIWGKRCPACKGILYASGVAQVPSF